jgi:hypothetical protein
LDDGSLRDYRNAGIHSESSFEINIQEGIDSTTNIPNDLNVNPNHLCQEVAVDEFTLMYLCCGCPSGHESFEKQAYHKTCGKNSCAHYHDKRTCWDIHVS